MIDVARERHPCHVWNFLYAKYRSGHAWFFTSENPHEIIALNIIMKPLKNCSWKIPVRNISEKRQHRSVLLDGPRVLAILSCHRVEIRNLSLYSWLCHCSELMLQLAQLQLFRQNVVSDEKFIYWSCRSGTKFHTNNDYSSVITFFHE